MCNHCNVIFSLNSVHKEHFYIIILYKVFKYNTGLKYYISYLQL